MPAGLLAVAVFPPFEVKTNAARAILSGQLSRNEAVRGWQRTAPITADLAAGKVQDLANLFTDACTRGIAPP